MASSSRSFDAFIARGIDTKKATWLKENNYTIAKLKSLSKQDLLKLGLTDEVATLINSESRPPIPLKTVTKLLHESKRICCVCRDPSKSVVIHHLVEWSISKDHSEGNLVVVCLEHHGDAHTKKNLAISLTSAQLKQHKLKWLSTVEKDDSKAVKGFMPLQGGAHWDYINLTRLFELAVNNGLRLETSRFYEAVRAINAVNLIGLVQDVSKWDVSKIPERRLYDCGEGMTVYMYTSHVLQDTLELIAISDVTDKWSAHELTSILSSGMYITIRGAFYYKDISGAQTGRNRRRLGYRRKDHIRIEFEFDAWETTSSTSDHCHLSGHQSSLAVLLVKSITKEDGWLVIRTSCLALGSGYIGDASFTTEWDESDEIEDSSDS